MYQDMASDCKGANSDFPSIVTSALTLSCGGTLSFPLLPAVFASWACKQTPGVCLQVRNFTHNKYYLRLRKWKVKESFIRSKCQVQIMTAGMYQSWAQSSPLSEKWLTRCVGRQLRAEQGTQESIHRLQRKEDGGGQVPTFQALKELVL